MMELLNELRIALPGVQFLLAFLLTVPFAQGFQHVTATQKRLFYAALMATAVSTILLIAPTATHRLRFHQRDRAFIIEAANKYLIGALIMLAVAIILAIAVVTDYLWNGWVVWVFPGLLASLILGIWFVRPLSRG